MLTLDVAGAHDKTRLPGWSYTNTKWPLDGAVLQVIHAIWALQFTPPDSSPQQPLPQS